MPGKEIDPKDYKHEWRKKPPEEWTGQDKKENAHYQRNKKPIRFQFGHDATDENIERFLDDILGPEEN